MKNFGGSVLFLDRSDINTDEIIPARYLTEVKKDALAPYLLEDLELDGFSTESENFKNAKVVISRENFGCGSSREHAPWALEVNDITVVIAQSYARIFRQNMFNCGMMAIELSNENIEKIFALDKKELSCSIDKASGKIIFSKNSEILLELDFTLSEFDSALVDAGGWVEFADSRY